MEQLGYVKALDGSPLYAAYHAADAEAAAHAKYRVYPVLLIPSLFEERKSAYAPLRRLALKLAAAGHAVLRFDFRGSGESGGDPAKRRWQHLAEDVAVARKTLARLAGARDSVLLGVRLGATLALQETLRTGGEGVLALAPVVNGAAQVRMWRMRSKIRSELTAEGANEQKSRATETQGEGLDFDGYPVAPAFFDDIAKINLLKDLAPLSCPGKILQISHREDPAPESLQLKDTLGSRVQLACLRMEAFWDRIDDVDTAPLEELVLRTLSQW